MVDRYLCSFLILACGACSDPERTANYPRSSDLQESPDIAQTHPRGRANLGLTAWRKVAEFERPIWTLGGNPLYPGQVVVAGEGPVFFVRLKDGKILGRTENAIMPVEDLAWVGERVFLENRSQIVLLKNGKIERVIRTPGEVQRCLSVDRRTSTLYCVADANLYRWAEKNENWSKLASAVGGRADPSVNTGVIVTSHGIVNEGKIYKSFSEPLKASRGAWVSPFDPQFLVVAGYPYTALSRDGGQTWKIFKNPLGPAFLVTGYESQKERLLFVEVNSGKMSFPGGTYGNSRLFVSQDNGQTFQKHEAPKTLFRAMTVVGETLVVAGRDKTVWAANIEMKK